MRIYDYPGFPNPLRVRMALAEKNLLRDVEFVTVDVPSGAHRQADFLAKNPSGAVPVLELEDGTVISECTAIIEYLDHAAGEPELTGRTPKERAVIHMMQRRAEAGLLDSVAAYFHHATPGLGPKLETQQNREWGEANRHRALAGMSYLGGVLEGQPYLAGDRYSMADITAYAGLAFADFVQIEVPEAATHLQAWRERVGARPATVAAAAG
jgi:glutathione S-transferase